jgi:hypothetical protein
MGDPISLPEWKRLAHERAAARKCAEAKADREEAENEVDAEKQPWSWESFWSEVETRLAASVDGRIAFYESRIAALERQVRELQERR